MRDNYFRTSLSRSEDEYDSDDLGGRDENIMAPTSKSENKNQPTEISLPNTTNPAVAVIAAKVPLNQPLGINGNNQVRV